jgi:hypothetical protein
LRIWHKNDIILENGPENIKVVNTYIGSTNNILWSILSEI